jgi:hypothetical protein
VLSFIGAISFAFVSIVLLLLRKGELVLPLLYLPGSIFGLMMMIALRNYSLNAILLFFLATVEYLLMIFFCSKDYEYLALRRVLMGGIGALLFLLTVKLLTEIRVGHFDIAVSFVIGILTTFFVWTENYESFNPWLMILSIVLWQTSIAAIINRQEILTRRLNRMLTSNKQ